MSLRRRAVSAVALSAVAAVLVPAAASAAVTLQPGAISATDAGRCTLNFAFSDGSDVYLGSAAHCVDRPGQRVMDADGDQFGTVALIGNADTTIDDYAFIKVDADERARVSPRVKGHPAVPTGVTAPGETRFGDTLTLSGFGLIFESTPLLQERRAGILADDDDARYRTIAPILFGDSGGPVVHTPTGKALGIVSRLCAGLCTEEGPTVAYMLRSAAARGLNLTLLTGTTVPAAAAAPRASASGH